MTVKYSTKTGLPLKPCKAGYERNPSTNRCRKKAPARCPAKRPANTPTKRKAPAKRPANAPTKKAPAKRPANTPRKRKPPAKRPANTPRKRKPPAKRPANAPTKRKAPAKRPANARANNRLTTWKDVMKAWKVGKHLPKINGSVFWETSAIKKGGDVEYNEQTLSASAALPMTLRGDSSPFRKHLDNKTSPVAFSNLTGSCTLVAPPDTGKNFSHLGLFYKNATQDEIRALWKMVAVQIEKKLKQQNVVYVSTHGTGVPWLHVRICESPKYFSTDVLHA